MSGLATSHSTPSKRARKSNGTTNDGSAVTGGSATPSKPTGTTAINEKKTTSPLNAALAEMKEGIESLPTVSQPLLLAQASKIIRLGVDHYHYGKKLEEAKSNPNYVSTSVKGINFELQVDADAQDGEAFKTIRNDLTAALEECRIEMTHKFVLPAQELTLEAKGKRYLAAICIYVHQLTSMYIAQGGTKDYDAHQAVVDLIYVKFDELFVPFSMKPCDFLPSYKAVHKLNLMPMPKVGASAGNTRITALEVLLHRLNGTSIGTSSSSSSSQAICTTLTLVDDTTSPADQTDDTPSSENDVDMDDIAQSYSNDIVGGKMYVLRQTWMAIQGTLHDAITKFNDQAKINDEALRIKKALTPATMSQSAARVSILLNKEAPVAPPILRGLIQEESTNVTAKTLELLQRRLQSTEDKLSAMTKSKKAGGGGTKAKTNTPRTGTPIAAKSNAQAKTNTPKESSKKKSEQKSNKSSSKKNSSKSKSRRDRDANNNATASDSRRSNGTNQQLSFDVRKNTTRIFSSK